MAFEHPNTMKDFPDSDDDKHSKKDILSGKKKDKRDRKDKEKGYAALEGESSADEDYEASPTKSKKSKSFKFTSKPKEKREKSRDKEKDLVEKKKDKERKIEKKSEKEKCKGDKKEKLGDIAEELPIFGVTLDLAVERSRCHDGIDLPLPFRACIDYLQMYGLGFEGIYKVSPPKSKVLHLKKMYNHRENVDLSEHDVPTVTGLLKMYLRDLPEPIFTSELLVRFEEAGAILNVAMREKHLKILVGNLSPLNYLILSWIIVHLYNITLSEKYTKMNAQNLAVALSSTLQTSHRLLTALLCHCPVLFEDVKLTLYIPPLTSTSNLPDEKELIENELKKQESLLSQIHAEMNAGFVSKQREELLWEVQRIITQLKRKIKSKNRELSEKYMEEETDACECSRTTIENVQSASKQSLKRIPSVEPVGTLETTSNITTETTIIDKRDEFDNNQIAKVENANECGKESPNRNLASLSDAVSYLNFSEDYQKADKSTESIEDDLSVVALREDKDIALLTLKNKALLKLQKQLTEKIEAEKQEIAFLTNKLKEYETVQNSIPTFSDAATGSLDEIMDLLQNENQILQINKINLVRKIVEQQEICIDLNVKLALLSNT